MSREVTKWKKLIVLTSAVKYCNTNICVSKCGAAKVFLHKNIHSTSVQNYHWSLSFVLARKLFHFSTPVSRVALRGQRRWLTASLSPCFLTPHPHKLSPYCLHKMSRSFMLPLFPVSLFSPCLPFTNSLPLLHWVVLSEQIWIMSTKFKTILIMETQLKGMDSN